MVNRLEIRAPSPSPPNLIYSTLPRVRSWEQKSKMAACQALSDRMSTSASVASESDSATCPRTLNITLLQAWTEKGGSLGLRCLRDNGGLKKKATLLRRTRNLEDLMSSNIPNFFVAVGLVKDGLASCWRNKKSLQFVKHLKEKAIPQGSYASCLVAWSF